MKSQYPLKIFGLLFVFLSSIFSCNNNEIESLERRVAELEAQLSVRDNVLLSDLEISSQESMNIIAGRGITNILGTLYIRNCVDLTPLMGLISVEGLYLEIPEGLNSLEGLNDLKATNYLDLFFQGNSNVDISALDGLETINNISLGGTLPVISWFPELNSLESIHVYAEIPSLIFSGFENLESIDYLSISNWQGDLDIQGFENLASANNLSFSASSLTVSGFNDIQSLSNMNIYGENLNISGLNGITSMDYLSLGANTLDISGFNGITNLNYMSFGGNTLEISGLSSLESAKNLDVFAEGSVTGLNKLKTITEYLNLNINASNNFLTDLVFASRLNIYSYSPGASEIKSISDMGLTSLSRIGGLTVDHSYLESLDGFDFSSSTLTELSIYNSPSLKDISSLSTYTGEIDQLSLYETALDSLDGMENITKLNNVTIVDNKLLGNWCAIKDIFDLIPTSQRYISGNLTNPASSEEITGCE